MNESTCIWNARGICSFDISHPGEQIECFGSSCRDFVSRVSADDLKKAETKHDKS